MKLNQDNWIVEAILDLEQTMISRKYTNSARGLADIRLQLIDEIYYEEEAANIDESNNVVRLFGN